MAPRYLKTGTRTSEEKKQQVNPQVQSTVREVIDNIRAQGDNAVRQYSQRFDKWDPASFKLSRAQVEEAMAKVPEQTVKDIKEVQRNVRTFAQAQLASLKDFELEIQPGVFLGQKNNPIDTVGAYIPGGRYPLLASAHMTILTAKVAGVPHVIACTPPINGELPNATITAMHLAGADEIFILGGVQAVAAMAVGTETIRKVDFIAGPGNPYVAEAKRALFGEVGIDLLAGPTEVLIVADERADPYTVATDLLSQAEHGPDTPAVLITNSEDLGRQTIDHVDKLLLNLTTAELAGTSWRDYGEVALVEKMDDAYALADEYASEHVQILTENPRVALDKMHNYGAIFLGERTCVSYGDKVWIFPIFFSSCTWCGSFEYPVADHGYTLVHWDQPCPSYAKSCPLHRRPLGRQVPADSHISRGSIG
jgi:histidinol dehydrogenase